MLKVLVSLFVLFGILTDVVSGAICEQKYTVETYKSAISHYYKCGWWNWGSCKVYKSVSTPIVKTRKICCPGSFGEIAINECNGVCPYKQAQLSEACNGRICRDYQCDDSEVVALPPPLSLQINENDDQERLLWTANTKCFVQESCPCADGSSCTCSKTVPCTKCEVQSTNGVAEVRDGTKIFRRKCTNTDCSDCRQYPGCLNHNVDYQIYVKCSASGYDDNDVVSQIIRLNVSKAPEPGVKFPEGDIPIKLATNAVVGHVLLKVESISIPVGESNETYSLVGPTSNATGQPLFRYKETTKEIIVNSDLSSETGGFYTVKLCINLRRKATCFGFVVNIERITTTTTTTTIRPTTTEPLSTYRCFGQGLYAAQHGMDFWCNEACGADPLNCPYTTHCTCVDVAEAFDEHTECRPGGFYAFGEYMTQVMTSWCNLNCNHGEYSNCPTDPTLPGYCICD